MVARSSTPADGLNRVLPTLTVRSESPYLFIILWFVTGKSRRSGTDYTPCTLTWRNHGLARRILSSIKDRPLGLSISAYNFFKFLFLSLFSRRLIIITYILRTNGSVLKVWAVSIVYIRICNTTVRWRITRRKIQTKHQIRVELTIRLLSVVCVINISRPRYSVLLFYVVVFFVFFIFVTCWTLRSSCLLPTTAVIICCFFFFFSVTGIIYLLISYQSVRISKTNRN